MTLFLALLTAAAQVGIVFLVLAWLLERVGIGSGWSRARAALGSDAIRLAALVAVVAMAGSLYLSEVRNFTPCTLCWYQRITLYPQALILVIAAIVGDRLIWRYSLPLALVGIVVSAYHVQLERFPDQGEIACSSEIPCTVIWYTELGYVTISVMALTASIAIALLVRLGAPHGQVITEQG